MRVKFVVFLVEIVCFIRKFFLIDILEHVSANKLLLYINKNASEITQMLEKVFVEWKFSKTDVYYLQKIQLAFLFKSCKFHQ